MKSFNIIFENTDSLNEFILKNSLQNKKNILVQIFSGIVNKDEILDITQYIAKKLPDAKIIGSTTAGEIVNGTIHEEKIVISFSIFNSTVIKSQLYNFENTDTKFDIVNDLLLENTKVLIVFSDGLNSNAELLLEELTSIKKDLVIAGGRAADNLKTKQTFIFNSEHCIENGCVIASLSGDELIVNNDYMLDFQLLGEKMVVTSAKNNQLFELDGIDIIDIYKKYLGDEVVKNLPFSAAEFPLVFQRNGINVARESLGLTQDNSLLFRGNIYEGESLQFSFASVDHIKSSVKSNFEKFIKFPSESIFIYSSSARKALMKNDLSHELKAFEKLATSVGFFTYGEYFHSSNVNELLNISTTFLSLSESSKLEKIEFDYAENYDDNRVLNTLSHVTSVISKELEESKERVRHLNKLLSVELSSQAKDLKTQKDLLENVINSTNDMIFYKDNDFNYIGCNKEFERFTNKKADKTICKNDYDLFSAEYAEVSRSMDEKTLKLKSTIVNYQWVEYPDGKKVYLLISRSPLKNKMGEIFGLVGIAKDITKEYRLENEKNSALDSLKAKSEFLANMSHEIRTPLNAILGFIDIVKENESNEENIEYLSIVQESGKNLLGIINDILDFSKIESNNLKLEYVQVNPFEKFEQISDIFLQRAEEKNITLKTIIDTNMPKCIKIDPLRISQVISNLLSNAIKFTPNNGNIIYKIDFLKDVNSIFISVKDTGIGIKEENIKYIFNPFTQADSSTTRYFGGTGLGLTISHKLVALMGGELKLKSEVDKGTELYFTIALPKCDTCLIPIEKRKIVNFVVNEVSFKGKKILLVEDNIANQMFMKVILKKLQLEFDIASDGLEAIDLFNLNKYDLIFMDENMPNLNGIETTKRILKIEKELNLPHTFIVALTAEALDGSREKFLNSGMDEFLTKPVNKKKIINVLEGFLNVK